MIRRWFEKRKRERVQANCPHEYSIVAEYQGSYYDGYDSSFFDAYDLYCPICEKTEYGITEIDKERILNRQIVRKIHEGGQA